MKKFTALAAMSATMTTLDSTDAKTATLLGARTMKFTGTAIAGC